MFLLCLAPCRGSAVALSPGCRGLVSAAGCILLVATALEGVERFYFDIKSGNEDGFVEQFAACVSRLMVFAGLMSPARLSYFHGRRVARVNVSARSVTYKSLSCLLAWEVSAAWGQSHSPRAQIGPQSREVVRTAAPCNGAGRCLWCVGGCRAEKRPWGQEMAAGGLAETTLKPVSEPVIRDLGGLHCE